MSNLVMVNDLKKWTTLEGITKMVYAPTKEIDITEDLINMVKDFAAEGEDELVQDNKL